MANFIYKLFKGSTEYNIKDEKLRDDLAEMWKQIYPIGSVYISANSTSPNSLFGGTWQSLGNGYLKVNNMVKNGTNPTDTGLFSNITTYAPNNYLAYTVSLSNALVNGNTYTLQLWDVYVRHDGKDSSNICISAYLGGGTVALRKFPTSQFQILNSTTGTLVDAYAPYLEWTFTLNSDHNHLNNAWVNFYNSPSRLDGYYMEMAIGKFRLTQASSAASGLTTGGSTSTGSTTLTVNQIAAHTHSFKTDTSGNHTHLTSKQNGHSHSLSSVTAHNHSISASGAHTHTTNTVTHTHVSSESGAHTHSSVEAGAHSHTTNVRRINGTSYGLIDPVKNSNQNVGFNGAVFTNLESTYQIITDNPHSVATVNTNTTATSHIAVTTGDMYNAPSMHTVAWPHTHTTSKNANHTHAQAGSAGAHSHTTANSPQHSHSSNSTGKHSHSLILSGAHTHSMGTATTMAHSHTGNTSSVGGGDPHSHSISGPPYTQLYAWKRIS